MKCYQEPSPLISGPRPSLWLRHSGKFSCWASQWLPPPPSSAFLAPFFSPPRPSCDTFSPLSSSSLHQPDQYFSEAPHSWILCLTVDRLTFSFNLFWISREISFLCLHTRFLPFLTLTSCSMLPPPWPLSVLPHYSQGLASDTSDGCYGTNTQVRIMRQFGQKETNNLFVYYCLLHLLKAKNYKS